MRGCVPVHECVLFVSTIFVCVHVYIVCSRFVKLESNSVYFCAHACLCVENVCE